ncbi:unnamed protein product, partial [Nesidiocoris tenuis]
MWKFITWSRRMLELNYQWKLEDTATSSALRLIDGDGLMSERGWDRDLTSRTIFTCIFT